MKKIYAISGLTVILIMLMYVGTCIANRETIKIKYSENKECSTFTANYPAKASAAVITHVNQWASQAAQRSGSLPETMKLKFANGFSCQVHAKGRNVEIIANRADNNAATLANLKEEGNAINELIQATGNRSR